MMKIWQKNIDVDSFVESFTVGRDREMDLQLAGADVLGSLAHTKMLASIGLMSAEDLAAVQRELKNIYQEVLDAEFQIEDSVEDVHSQVEMMLTQRIGKSAYWAGKGLQRTMKLAELFENEGAAGPTRRTRKKLAA